MARYCSGIQLHYEKISSDSYDEHDLYVVNCPRCGQAEKQLLDSERPSGSIQCPREWIHDQIL